MKTKIVGLALLASMFVCAISGCVIREDYGHYHHHYHYYRGY